METTWISIDFGTSNTVAMLSVPGREPRPLLFDGSPLLPSAVYAGPDGRLVVGRDAWHAGSSNPAGLEPFPKRHMHEESLLLDGRVVPLVAVVTAILRHVSTEADGVLGHHVDSAVLTCPASWAGSRRGRLEAAGRSVFGRVRLLAEPVAAAHHHLSRIPATAPGHFLVYDLGAGTFDASVVRHTPEGVELLASAGLDDAGGLDIDAAVVDHLGDILAARDPDRWERLGHPRDRADRRARRHLWDSVRTAKEVLSRTATTLVHVPSFDDDLPLGRERLDALAGPVLERTVAVCRDLSAAVDASGPLRGIFLVGGGSRMPLVQTRLHQAFGMVPTGIEQPELVVAEGALASAVLRDADGRLPTGTTAAQGRPGTDGTAAQGRPGTDGAAADVRPPTGGEPGRMRPAPTALGRPWPLRAGRHGRWIGAVVVPVLIAAGLWLGLREWSPAGRVEQVPSRSAATLAGGPTPSATPTPGPSPVVDPCLVGTWESTNYSITNYIDRVPTTFTSSGGTVKTIRADGSFVHDYGPSAPRTARIGRDRWQQHVTGTISGRIRTVDRTILYSALVAKGSSRFVLNGRDRGSDRLTAHPAPSTYLCDGDAWTEYTDDYRIEYARRPAG
ncbi:Hsp70 family protein [Plantactinospora sp. WMMB334]|uniref:Hsp70 family protein n=1 Tax=Plantactinospora sp. WMMB334 TaxID=3404119 RepID=UPI003B9573CA